MIPEQTVAAVPGFFIMCCGGNIFEFHYHDLTDSLTFSSSQCIMCQDKRSKYSQLDANGHGDSVG